MNECTKNSQLMTFSPEAKRFFEQKVSFWELKQIKNEQKNGLSFDTAMKVASVFQYRIFLNCFYKNVNKHQNLFGLNLDDRNFYKDSWLKKIDEFNVRVEDLKNCSNYPQWQLDNLEQMLVVWRGYFQEMTKNWIG